MINESNNNATIPKERHSVYLVEDVNKSRRFRWSSCFSFITTKFKKSKLQQKNRHSHSFSDEFEHKNYVPENISPVEKVQVSKSVGASTSASWKQQLNTTSSLSPPPRQTKNKRDSSMSQKIDTNVKKDRRPLIDPTLTPRVKPRSIKTSKNQPSLLRLSLDAELLQSPDGIYTLQDNESNNSTTTSHSSLSFSPISSYPAPFRSGTLGAAVKHPKLKMDNNENIPPPPLPKINILDKKRPQSQSTTHSQLSYSDSPTNTTLMQSGVEFIADEQQQQQQQEEEKLTLKERRHRRSPLSMPDTDQLTLALKSQPSTTTTVEEIVEQEDDQLWRQQLLEQTIAYSFQNNKSRQDAMMILEGKKPRAISLQPIVAVHKLDDHFCTDNKKKTGDVVKDKAIVSHTSLSHEEKKFNFNNYRTSSSSSTTTGGNEKKILQETQPLGIIAENEIITTTTTPISANKMLLFTNGHRLSVTPETPPHHQLNAPSLISAPSTPNSIDSSVLEHDDFDRLHQLGFVSQ